MVETPGTIRSRNPEAPDSPRGGLDQSTNRGDDAAECSLNRDSRCLNVVDRFRSPQFAPAFEDRLKLLRDLIASAGAFSSRAARVVELSQIAAAWDDDGPGAHGPRDPSAGPAPSAASDAPAPSSADASSRAASGAGTEGSGISSSVVQ